MHVCVLLQVWGNAPKTFYKRSVGRQQHFATASLKRLSNQCQELSTKIAFDEVPQIAYLTSWTWEIPPGQNICDKALETLETPLLFPPSPPTELPPPDEVRSWIGRHWRICKGKKHLHLAIRNQVPFQINILKGNKYSNALSIVRTGYISRVFWFSTI